MAGWITALEVDGARILASVDWTAAGRAAVMTREYRFISPAFNVSAPTGGEVRRIWRGPDEHPRGAGVETGRSATRGPQFGTTLRAKIADHADLAGPPPDTDPAFVLKTTTHHAKRFEAYMATNGNTISAGDRCADGPAWVRVGGRFGIA